MTLDIHWNILDSNHSQRKNEKLVITNLLQSRAYAIAQCRMNKQLCRIGKIFINGEEAGCVQILEAKILKGAIHAVILDRGPLWFEGYGSQEHIESFFKEFARQFPRRLGRMRRIIPEVEYSVDALRIFQALGYKKKNNPAYETIILDLNLEAEKLRKNMRKDWRASLRKAESHGQDLIVEWDTSCRFFPWFCENYLTDRALKKYNGPSSRLLNEFVKTFGIRDNMLIGRALYKGEAVAGVLILCHGNGATYQVGWNHSKGREVRAHNLLLWNALCVLKKRDIKNFDLGGINDESAAGVKEFKTGLAGKKAKILKLAGFYA